MPRTIPADSLPYATYFSDVLRTITIPRPPKNARPGLTTDNAARRHASVERWKAAIFRRITEEEWKAWPTQGQEFARTAVLELKADFNTNYGARGTCEDLDKWLRVYRDLTILVKLKSMRAFLKSESRQLVEWRDPFLDWLQTWLATQSNFVRDAARSLIIADAEKPHDYIAFRGKCLIQAGLAEQSGGPVDMPALVSILQRLHPQTERTMFGTFEPEELERLIEKLIELNNFMAQHWDDWPTDMQKEVMTNTAGMIDLFWEECYNIGRSEAIDHLSNGLQLATQAHTNMQALQYESVASTSTAHSLAPTQSYRRISHRTASRYGTTKRRWEAGRW
ncbi:hypothetical protein JCM11641_003298 [Rhodosporidiobolus odoratus]